MLMKRRPLPHYLLTERKRWALKQRQVAFLLGIKTGGQISRYECRNCVPYLRTALACEVIFGVPVRTLFRGMYETIEEQIIERAYLLYQELEHHTDPDGLKNLELLKEMLARATKKPNQQTV